MRQTATLKISKAGLSPLTTEATITDSLCRLAKAGYIGGAEMTRNVSIVDGEKERGYNITLFQPSSPNVVAGAFLALKLQLGIGCAWLDLTLSEDSYDAPFGEYHGCIKEWLPFKRMNDEGTTKEALDIVAKNSPVTEVGVRKNTEPYTGQPSPGRKVWDA